MEKYINLNFMLLALLFFSGCQKNVDQSLLAPEANFGTPSTTVFKGFPVSFTDLSTNSPTSWTWTFNGGTPSFSTAQSPTNIVYANPGVYDVSLTVSNSDGSDTKTMTGYITINDANVQTLLDNNISIDVILGMHPLDSLYGRTYEGGLIFYYNSSNSRGFVAADIDQSINAVWGCTGSNISNHTCSSNSLGGTNHGIYYPPTCLGANSAWGICDYLIYNSKNDWMLPSISTLNYMYQNLRLKGHGNFGNDTYWSYCQTSASYARAFSMSSGAILDNEWKSTSHRVRAIREF